MEKVVQWMESEIKEKGLRLERVEGIGVTRREKDRRCDFVLSNSGIDFSGIDKAVTDKYCPYQEVERAFRDRKVQVLEGESIRHMVFPEISVPDMDDVMVCRLQFPLHDEAEMEIIQGSQKVEYVCEKTDGVLVLFFSLNNGKWHSFVWTEGRVIYQGQGYRVGTVERCGSEFSSAFVAGRILIDGVSTEIKKKPVKDMIDMYRGHKDGVIISVAGTEYRVKAVTSHDMIVVKAGPETSIVATGEGSFTQVVASEKISLNNGDIVEVARGKVRRLRTDKIYATQYDSVKKSATVPTLASLIRICACDDMLRDYRAKEIIVIAGYIRDKMFYSSVMQGLAFNELAQMFPAYSHRSVLVSVMMMGYSVKSGVIVANSIVSYADYVHFVESASLAISVDDEGTIHDNVAELVVPGLGLVDDNEELYDFAMMYISSATTEKKHSAVCLSRVVRAPTLGCPACIRDVAIQVIYNRVAHVGMVGEMACSEDCGAGYVLASASGVKSMSRHAVACSYLRLMRYDVSNILPFRDIARGEDIRY